MRTEILARADIEIRRYLKKHMLKDDIVNSNLYSKVFDHTYHGCCEQDWDDHRYYVAYVINKYIEILYSKRAMMPENVLEIMLEKY